MNGDRALVHVTRIGEQDGQRGRWFGSCGAPTSRWWGVSHPQARQFRCRHQTTGFSNGSRFRKAWKCRAQRSSVDRVGVGAREKSDRLKTWTE